jgi:hypothetical protein
MRLSIALAVLVLSLCLGACAREGQVAYAYSEFPPTEVTEVKFESSPRPKTSVYRPITAETAPAAAAMALETPKDIIASLIRSQGYACDSPQSAELASEAHEVVWMLDCQNASYRVTIIPGMGDAKVDKVGEVSPSSSSSGL